MHVIVFICCNVVYFSVRQNAVERYQKKTNGKIESDKTLKEKARLKERSLATLKRELKTQQNSNAYFRKTLEEVRLRNANNER